MLSPHEYSALVIIKHGFQSIEALRDEIAALVDRGLISVEAERSAQLTPLGKRLLEVLSSAPDDW
jgi:predicted transcriptional regulator